MAFHQAGFFQAVQAEVGGSIVAEQLRARRRIVETVEVGEELRVQFADAVELERSRMLLESDAAQDDGGEVAAIDRQSCIARQGRRAVVRCRSSTFGVLAHAVFDQGPYGRRCGRVMLRWRALP